MARRRWLFTAVLGATASALLGSSLLAVVVDSASSTDNSIGSNALAPPPADLRVGVLDEGDECNEAATEDVSTFPAVLDSALITLQAGEAVESARVCFYNAGASDGWLQMGFGNVVDLEANSVPGQCDNAEADELGGNDQTCGDGDAGELAPVLAVAAYEVVDCGGPCFAVPPPYFSFADVADGGMPLVRLARGSAIAYDIEFRVDENATQQELQAAQTDRLQFDMVFSLADEAPVQ